MPEPDGTRGWEALNARMVERMKTTGAIRSPQIEEAFRETPRHLFLPGINHDLVYSGQAIVTRSDPERGATSSSSEVFIMGPMLEALAVEPGHRVLEIGAGTGYNAALMDRLVGPAGEVVSIDVQPDVADEARGHLVAAGHPGVRVVTGDGSAGWAERAPYDRIIATASVRDIPLAWRDQLREGGRLTVPMRFRPGGLMVVTFRREREGLRSVAVVAGGFMPLRIPDESVEEAVTFGEDWEATMASAQDGDGELLADLLRAEPTIEPFGTYQWQITFSVIGLLDPDWVVIRQKQRPTVWFGVLDRASRSLALLWPIQLPVIGARGVLLVYGSKAARERLAALVDELSGVTVSNLRVQAIPSDGAKPEADIVFEGRNFFYAIDWRQAKSTA